MECKSYLVQQSHKRKKIPVKQTSSFFQKSNQEFEFHEYAL